MFGEAPAIIEAERAAGRVRGVDRMTDERFDQVAADISGINDTAAHRLIETVGAGSDMPSASRVRNAVMDRAADAKEDMRGFLWRMANDASGANAGRLFHGTPAPTEVLDIAEMVATNARQLAHGADTAAHNKVAMGAEVYGQLYRDVNSSLARIRGRANSRAGEYAAQMHNAAREVEDLIQQTGGRYLVPGPGSVTEIPKVLNQIRAHTPPARLADGTVVTGDFPDAPVAPLVIAMLSAAALSVALLVLRR